MRLQVDKLAALVLHFDGSFGELVKKVGLVGLACSRSADLSVRAGFDRGGRRRALLFERSVGFAARNWDRAKPSLRCLLETSGSRALDLLTASGRGRRW